MGHWPILPEAWDAWLAEQGFEGSFLQSGAWAAVSHAVNGTEAHLVLVTADEASDPAAGVLLTATRVERRLELTCHEGPVLPASVPEALLDALLDQTDELAASLGASIVRFTGGPPGAAWLDSPHLKATFERRGYRCIPWRTALVDLQRSDEELMSGFRRAARKSVRRCQELGVSVSECQTLEEYVRLYLEPNELPTDRARKLWGIDRRRHYRFFAALDSAGTVLATLGSYRFNGVATEIESRRTLAGYANGAPAQDLLHWELFRAHRADGDSLFNLGGFAAVPTNEKEAGIRRFKEKWAGRVVPLLLCELDRRPLITRAVNRAAHHARRAVGRLAVGA